MGHHRHAPIAHWVWGGGWIGDLKFGESSGALDFAGGTVVHINAGVAAVAAVLLIGKRRDPGVEPHNVPYVVLGAALLWFGWFGFNAGSGLAANGVDVNAFLVTNTAAAAAALTWGLLSQFQTGRMRAVGVASGAVAGLVAITPASGYVGVMGALAIGFGAGILCYIAVYFRHRTGIDDALEVFAVHGVGGIWGALAVGVFAVKVIGEYRRRHRRQRGTDGFAGHLRRRHDGVLLRGHPDNIEGARPDSGAGPEGDSGRGGYGTGPLPAWRESVRRRRRRLRLVPIPVR